MDRAIFSCLDAPDPVAALPNCNRKWPDVIVLDVEMPRMDGITFLKQLMATHPVPVKEALFLINRVGGRSYP